MYNLINHPGLRPLLPSLSSLFKDVCWNRCLKEKNLTEDSNSIIQITTDYQKSANIPSGVVFGTLNGYVQKFKFKEETIFPNYNGFLNNDTKNSNDTLNIDDGGKINDKKVS